MKEETQQLLAQGLLAGVLGHVTAAVVFAVANAMAGRPLLYTPAVLGASLFYGLTDPSQLEIRAAYVFAYNGTHLLVFIAFGLVAAAGDRGPRAATLVCCRLLPPLRGIPRRQGLPAGGRPDA